MKSVLCEGTQPAGTPTIAGSAVGSGSVVQWRMPALFCVRTGNSAAAIAAGLVDVWSTIRFEITRGWSSNTKPFFCAYDELGIVPLPGPKKSVGLPCAALKIGVVRRGNG